MNVYRGAHTFVSGRTVSPLAVILFGLSRKFGAYVWRITDFPRISNSPHTFGNPAVMIAFGPLAEVNLFLFWSSIGQMNNG
jgi:hypothetical protein